MGNEHSVNQGILGGWKPGAGGSEVDACGFGTRAAVSAEDLRTARLIKTIEAEIVPRLVLTRRVPIDLRPASVQPSEIPENFDVKELVRLLLSHDVSVAAAYVETVLERGTNLEAICLNLLAPAARELGLLWEEDECDFMQVTVGLCRLHQILRNIAPELPAESPIPGPERGILLAAIPGEQHTFGIALVAQFLMQAGWDVWQEFPQCNNDILEIVRHNWFTVVGLSIGSDTRLEELSVLIKDIRAASRNRQVGILAGGPVLVQQPELAAALGADATAADGRQTVRWMESVCHEIRF